MYIWFAPNIVGVFNGEGPPVPIPNTEVKLTSGDNTCLATDWKDSSTPTQRAPGEFPGFFFYRHRDSLQFLLDITAHGKHNGRG